MSEKISAVNMASSSRTLSRIPHLEKGNGKEDEEIDLAELALFGSENQKQKYLESFRFMDSAFPFFIKEEHHDMASSKMKEGQGEYWGQAIHFLLCNKAHGFPLWNKFEEQMRSEDASFSCKPHVSTKTTKSSFKHYFDESANNFKNALDILTQDSVLVQLPFQPGLLFQWLTSSLANFWTVENQCSPFYYLPAPEKFRSELVNLHNLLKTTERNIGFLFDYLQCQITSKTEIFVGNLKVFDMILKKVLVFHKFCTKEYGIKYIAQLKKKCWQNWRSNEKSFRLEKGNMSLTKRNFLFNPDFWRGLHKDLKIFGNSNEQLVRVQDLTSDRSGEQLSVNKIKKILNYLLPTDALPNVDFSVIEQNCGLLKSFHKAIQAKYELDQVVSINKDERGILRDLITMNYDIEFNEAISEVCSWIVHTFSISPNHLVDDTFYHNFKPEYYVHLSMEDIEKSVIDLEARCYYWRKRSNQERRKINKFTTLQVSCWKLQKRILDIVQNCIDAHLEIVNFENQKDDVLRDWQVVQYLMPCFVASYLNICESKPPVEESFKKWYFKFIDSLIRTYETDGIRKSSWKNVKKDVDRITELRESFHEKNADLLKFFKGVTEKFNKKFSEDRRSLKLKLKYCPCLMSLFQVLTNSTIEGPPQNDVATQSCVYWNWLMWDFFSRIEKALNLSTN